MISSNTKRFHRKELLIGLCEGEVDAVEVVIGQESFGSLTPERILQKEIIFNYVRPADTDTNNKVTFVFNDNNEDYQDQRIIYKYKRNSSSKFIDIDIQNADTCFFDSSPLKTTTCYYINGCPPDAKNCKCFTRNEEALNNNCPPGIEECSKVTECSSPDSCSPSATNCSCSTSIKMRKNLSPLPSCSGKALDMSTLDTDTTQCTDTVFFVAASKTGQKLKSYRYYKHCPVNQDYCYFGKESDRPSDHRCPSS